MPRITTIARTAALTVLVTLVVVSVAPTASPGPGGGRGTTTTSPVVIVPPTTATPATTADVPVALPPTTVPAAPPTTVVEAPASLRPGDDGPEVLTLQQRLDELGFWLGSPDGGYGRLTGQAVLAFQKHAGLVRDGIAGPATRAALDVAGRPVPRSTEDGIEIDLGRQLLLVVDGGAVRWAINTSTGAPATPTPPGAFTVDRQIDGVRRAPLGDLYRPKYFNAGIAVHGSPSIPGHPASHGCARVSDPAMDLLWSSGRAEPGTRVSVYR